MTELFDLRLLARRRDRAARLGVETFLYDRAFEDCLDRLADLHNNFRSILLAGCPNPAWPQRLTDSKVCVIDPSPLMAVRAGGQCAHLERLPFEAESFDLCICIGLLETANDLALAAAALNLVLKPGGLLLCAMAGGQSLPRLRNALLAADRLSGLATPRVHPRIEPPSLASLLTQAGFVSPVVDLDRVELGYSSLDNLVRDLRAMGATNVLCARSRKALSRAAFDSARSAFLAGNSRVTEQIDIVHAAGWKST